MLENLFNGFQLLHVILALFGAVGFIIFWSRTRFWIPKYAHVLAVSGLVLLLPGCINNGIEWSELSWTRTKPNLSDLVGTWVPTDATINDMKERGGYTISIHHLILRADGTFEMTNMPDWWKDGFGESKKGFESGVGNWQLYEDPQGPWSAWAVELQFSNNFVVLNQINVRRQKPPYLLHLTVGDPDSGHIMLFEKKS